MDVYEYGQTEMIDGLDDSELSKLIQFNIQIVLSSAGIRTSSPSQLGYLYLLGPS